MQDIDSSWHLCSKWDVEELISVKGAKGLLIFVYFFFFFFFFFL